MGSLEIFRREGCIDASVARGRAQQRRTRWIAVTGIAPSLILCALWLCGVFLSFVLLHSCSRYYCMHLPVLDYVRCFPFLSSFFNLLASFLLPGIRVYFRTCFCFVVCCVCVCFFFLALLVLWCSRIRYAGIFASPMSLRLFPTDSFLSYNTW